MKAVGPVRAGDLADFKVAVETVSAHDRVRFGYLRTDNIDLATVAFDKLDVAWKPAHGVASPESGRTPSTGSRSTSSR